MWPPASMSQFSYQQLRLMSGPSLWAWSATPEEKKTSPTSVHFWSSPSLWWMTRLHLFCSSVARWWKLEKHFGAASNERETSRQALRQGVKLVLPSWQSLGAACCSVLPLSSPNPSKRTWPASSAGLCSLLSLWWSVLAAQKPKCSKTDLASLVRGCAPCSPSGVGFGRLAAQILRSGLLALPLVSVLTLSSPNLPSQLGCAPCSPSGGPFWPLSSPNSPKRTSPAWSAWLCWNKARLMELETILLLKSQWNVMQRCCDCIIIVRARSLESKLLRYLVLRLAQISAARSRKETWFLRKSRSSLLEKLSNAPHCSVLGLFHLGMSSHDARNQSWLCFLSGRFSATIGKDHFFESRKPMGSENEIAAVTFSKTGAAVL